jgi:cephalosporin-C deacetylase
MPLMFDLPLEQLKTYAGRNARPQDFDAFWERGLQEMKNIDPRVKLKAAAFAVPYAECFDLFFTGVGQARIHARLVRPKSALKPHPAVLKFHGYSGNAGSWIELLPYAALGHTIAALDCRGQGGLSEDTGGVSGNTLNGHIIRGLDDPPEKMLFRQIFLDTAQLAAIVMGMPDVDPGRVGAFGGSQGGGLTLACAALEPKIKRAVPIYPFLTDYRRTWEMDLAKDAYKELRDYFRNFDPLHQRENEIFTKLGYIDVQHLCPRIKAEIMMPVGLMDTICPPSTQFAAYNKITAKKSLLLYPDFGHEGLPDVGDKVLQFMMGL